VNADPYSDPNPAFEMNADPDLNPDPEETLKKIFFLNKLNIYF
jgi:hypothetical protein